MGSTDGKVLETMVNRKSFSNTKHMTLACLAVCTLHPDENKPASHSRNTVDNFTYIQGAQRRKTKRLKLQKHSHTFIVNKTPLSINFIHFSFVSPDPHEFESPGWGPKPDL